MNEIKNMQNLDSLINQETINLSGEYLEKLINDIENILNSLSAEGTLEYPDLTQYIDLEICKKLIVYSFVFEKYKENENTEISEKIYYLLQRIDKIISNLLELIRQKFSRLIYLSLTYRKQLSLNESSNPECYLTYLKGNFSIMQELVVILVELNSVGGIQLEEYAEYFQQFFRLEKFITQKEIIEDHKPKNQKITI